MTQDTSRRQTRGTPQTGLPFELQGASLIALPSGALHWPGQSLLVVSDLHLGKSERIARLGGASLPPYEALDTLERLEADLQATAAQHVLCLGDSFDDRAAAEGLGDQVLDWLMQLQAGRDWTWIEGNHDPGPLALGGTHLAELVLGPLLFRHIATPDFNGSGSASRHPPESKSAKSSSAAGTGADGRAEVSGHYHPKARVAGRAHRCFLVDRTRLILPAYGTYTGGLWCHDPALSGLMAPQALAILTGRVARAVPMPRR